MTRGKMSIESGMVRNQYGVVGLGNYDNVRAMFIGYFAQYFTISYVNLAKNQ